MKKTIIFATGLLLFLTLPVLAVTPTTWTTEFTSKKTIDTSDTTASLNTDEDSVELPLSYKVKTWESADGLPVMNVTSGSASSSTWLIGGANGYVVKYHDGTFTDLPSLLTGFSGAITSIGTNGTTWLLGGNKQLWSYDGSTATDLSSAFNAAFITNFVQNIDTAYGSAYVRDIEWNGQYWLITGAGGAIVKYDGTTFTDLRSVINFGKSELYAAWQSPTWFLVGPNGQTMTYDGQTVTNVTSPFTSGYFKVAGGNGQWVVYGLNPPTMTLSTYDGNKFTDVTKALVTASTANDGAKLDLGAWTVGNVVWDGESWMVSLSAHDSTKSHRLFIVRRDWSKATEISYAKTGTYDFYSFAAGVTSDGWVAFGNKVADNTPTAFAVAGTIAYTTSAVVQSPVKTIKLTKKQKTIASVVVTLKKSSVPSTAYTLFVSNDGGKHWTKSTPGKKVSFTTRGKSLVWKITLKTSNKSVTPVLKKVTVKYTIK